MSMYDPLSDAFDSLRGVIQRNTEIQMTERLRQSQLQNDRNVAQAQMDMKEAEAQRMQKARMMFADAVHTAMNYDPMQDLSSKYSSLEQEVGQAKSTLGQLTKVKNTSYRDAKMIGTLNDQIADKEKSMEALKTQMDDPYHMGTQYYQKASALQGVAAQIAEYDLNSASVILDSASTALKQGDGYMELARKARSGTERKPSEKMALLLDKETGEVLGSQTVAFDAVSGQALTPADASPELKAYEAKNKNHEWVWQDQFNAQHKGETKLSLPQYRTQLRTDVIGSENIINPTPEQNAAVNFVMDTWAKGLEDFNPQSDRELDSLVAWTKKEAARQHNEYVAQRNELTKQAEIDYKQKKITKAQYEARKEVLELYDKRAMDYFHYLPYEPYAKQLQRIRSQRPEQ